MSTQSQVLEKLVELINLVNATNTNAKKIDELPLQEIIDPASRIHVSIDGISKRIDISQLISAVANGNYNQLLNIGEITVIGNVITVPSGAIWTYGNVNYTTTSDTSITVTLAATGMNRKDILVGNTSGNIVHELGDETAGAIVIRPNIPADSILITEFDVSDSNIGDPTPPIVGDQFVEKIEFLDNFLSNSGSISIPLQNKSTSFILTGSVTEVLGFEMIDNFLTSDFYIGKELRIENQTGSPFTFKHDGATNLPALFPLESDFIVNDKDILIFKPQKHTQLGAKFISINRTLFEIDAVNGLQSALDDKLDAADYNDRFRGKYTSLANLQAAHPTANDGDYAIVDTGSGTDALEYIWDANEGWVKGNSTGATTTDALPEGSTNLYFQTARVLATVLTGISFATGGAIVSTDTILQAFGKIQKQINDLSTVYQAILTDVNFGSFINGLASKTTPVDADQIGLMDSADSNKQKKLSIANLKALIFGISATETVTGVVNTTTQTFGGNKIIVGSSNTTGNAFELQRLDHTKLLEVGNNRNCILTLPQGFSDTNGLVFKDAVNGAQSLVISINNDQVRFYSPALINFKSSVNFTTALRITGLNSSSNGQIVLLTSENSGNLLGLLTFGKVVANVVGSTTILGLTKVFFSPIVYTAEANNGATYTGLIGSFHKQLIKAQANNSVLIGMQITPNYDDNSFTGNTKIALGIEASAGFGIYQVGSIVNYIEGVLGIGTSTPTSGYKLEVNGKTKAGGVINLKSYTVSTLPAGTEGDTAYVTDATAPTYLGALTGGGSVKCPVFYNGTAWVSH